MLKILTIIAYTGTIILILFIGFAIGTSKNMETGEYLAEKVWEWCGE